MHLSDPLVVRSSSSMNTKMNERGEKILFKNTHCKDLAKFFSNVTLEGHFSVWAGKGSDCERSVTQSRIEGYIKFKVLFNSELRFFKFSKKIHRFSL